MYSLSIGLSYITLRVQSILLTLASMNLTIKLITLLHYKNA